MLAMLPMLPYYQCCILPHHTGIPQSPLCTGTPTLPHTGTPDMDMISLDFTVHE